MPIRMSPPELFSPAAHRTLGVLLVAAFLPMSIGSASAAGFTLTANSTTAQTLGNGDSGALATGKSLT
ncbi:MAG: hypothetical protein GZ090_15265, partial [Oxalobacteraceae bacterium]|nr:hypothetical protein [Oxalobacteraceae bacterium]